MNVKCRQVPIVVPLWMGLCHMLNVFFLSPTLEKPTVVAMRMMWKEMVSGAARERTRWTDTPRDSGEYVLMRVPLVETVVPSFTLVTRDKLYGDKKNTD